MANVSKPVGGARTRARRAALQALYAWQINGRDSNIVPADFLSQWELPSLHEDFFQELVREIPAHTDNLDAQLELVIDRPLRQIDPVERAVLWIGLYELTFCPDIPWRVAVNEAVELAKFFGAEKSHKYINGILDRIVKQKDSATKTTG